MKRRITWQLIVWLASVFVVCNVAPAGIIHQYLFDGDLDDTLGGPSLTAAGGTVGGQRYTFATQQGLSVSNALPSSDVYSIVMKFEFDNTGPSSSYKKIVDFSNRTADIGLYLQNGQLRLFSYSTAGSRVVSANEDIILAITRSVDINNVGTFSGYIDGILQFSLTDSSNFARFTEANNIVHFFIDDSTGTENPSGSVDWIEIYDNVLSASEIASISGPTAISAVPEPSSLALCVVVATGIGGWRRVRRSRDTASPDVTSG